jgi:hypothetical protein
VPHINSKEPCYFTKVPDGPQSYTLNVLWFQEEGAQIHMSEWSQSFTLTKNVGRGFILCSTPTQWTVLTAPLGEDVCSGYYVLLGKWGCCPEYTYKINESRRKHQRCTNVMSGRCATRMNSFTLPYAFKWIRSENRIILKTKTENFFKALRPGNGWHMLTVMKIFSLFNSSI